MHGSSHLWRNQSETQRPECLARLTQMAGPESGFESWGMSKLSPTGGGSGWGGMLHNKEEFQASAISQGRDVAALSLPRLFQSSWQDVQAAPCGSWGGKGQSSTNAPPALGDISKHTGCPGSFTQVALAGDALPVSEGLPCPSVRVWGRVQVTQVLSLYLAFMAFVTRSKLLHLSALPTCKRRMVCPASPEG